MEKHGLAEITKHTGSRLTTIKQELVKLAERRQAAISPNTLTQYAADLAEYHPEDLTKALDTLGKRPRRDGETAFPDLGTILEEVYPLNSSRRSIERLTRQAADEKAHRESIMAERAEEERQRKDNPEVFAQRDAEAAKKKEEWEAKLRDLGRKKAM